MNTKMYNLKYRKNLHTNNSVIAHNQNSEPSESPDKYIPDQLKIKVEIERNRESTREFIANPFVFK